MRAWTTGLLASSIVALVVGCGASGSPVAAVDTRMEPPKSESAPDASSSAASSSGPSPDGGSPATAAPTSGDAWAAPRFTSGKMGQVLLRCEAPEAPTDVAAGCLCGSTILSPCETRPTHTVDRRQCLFTCTVEGGNTSRLHCPDGAVPTKEPGGCGCGPGRVLTPCANGAAPKSMAIEGKECRVVCG